MLCPCTAVRAPGHCATSSRQHLQRLFGGPAGLRKCTNMQWRRAFAMDIKMETEGAMRCTAGYPEGAAGWAEWLCGAEVFSAHMVQTVMRQCRCPQAPKFGRLTCTASSLDARWTNRDMKNEKKNMSHRMWCCVPKPWPMVPGPLGELCGFLCTHLESILVSSICKHQLQGSGLRRGPLGGWSCFFSAIEFLAQVHQV